MRKESVPTYQHFIENKIFSNRGRRVMLDRHLAALYGVRTIRLREQVKRNVSRFPHDFMFQLNDEEVESMVSHFAIPSRKHLGGFNPYVFTEEGIAMLSSVLRSRRAIQANIAIMRAFVRLRRILGTHKDLARKLDELERKYDSQFRVVFDAIRQLMAPEQKPQRRIGFDVKGN